MGVAVASPYCCSLPIVVGSTPNVRATSTSVSPISCWLIGLLIYRHGLRVSEACGLRWDDIDLTKRTIIVRRLKGSTDSVHRFARRSIASCR